MALPGVLIRLRSAGLLLARSYPQFDSPFHGALARWRRAKLPPQMADLRIRLPAGGSVVSGEKLIVEIFLLGLLATGDGEISLAVHDARGTLIHETLLSRLGAPPLRLRFGEARTLRIELPLPLAPGRYRLHAGFHPENNSAERPPVYAGVTLKVAAPPAQRRFLGVVDLQPRLAEFSAGSPTAEAVRRWETLVPARLEIGEAENPLLMGGFYSPEQSPAGPFRWTSDTASLQLRLAGPRVLLHYLGCRPDVARNPVTVTVQVEGTMLGSCVLKAPFGTLNFTCPESLRGQVVTLKITIKDCWRPSELGINPGDHRLLGIALSAVEAAGDPPQG